MVSAETEKKFMDHIAEFGLSFATSEEYNFRLQQFQKHDDIYNEINSNKLNTFTVGHNQFSTWTDYEYGRLLGEKNVKQYSTSGKFVSQKWSDATSIDWRALGKVSPIQNQGMCGSCWAFAASAAMESSYMINANLSEAKLAEQQFVDCDTQCSGCNGGLGRLAFEYAETTPVAHETDYPYAAAD